MQATYFPIDARLRRAARVPGIAEAPDRRVTALEWATLLGAGITASLLTNLLRLRLGIPGSSIVFVAFPLALGFALVPRRGSGFVMAGGAFATSAALGALGVRLDGVGAQASLLLTGPLLDLALRQGGEGWRLYGAFIAACTASNACAFAVRLLARLAGIGGAGHGGGGGRSAAAWLPEAVWTYGFAGLLAGLISVAAWFQLRNRPT